MATSTDLKRLNSHLSDEQKEKLQRAADLLGDVCSIMSEIIDQDRVLQDSVLDEIHDDAYGAMVVATNVLTVK